MAPLTVPTIVAPAIEGFDVTDLTVAMLLGTLVLLLALISVPVGGVMISEPIAKAFDERVFPGGLTYSGHPLAMGSIVGALTAMADEGIVENAARIGTEVLGPGLAALAEESALIGEVRGLGVFWAMELVADKETRAPLPADRMARIKSGLIGAGMLPFVQDNRIHVVPPCVITDDEARAGLAIYREVLAANA